MITPVSKLSWRTGHPNHYVQQSGLRSMLSHTLPDRFKRAAFASSATRGKGSLLVGAWATSSYSIASQRLFTLGSPFAPLTGRLRPTHRFIGSAKIFPVEAKCDHDCDQYENNDCNAYKNHPRWLFSLS